MQNDFSLEAIRGGLSNYIGSCLGALPKATGIPENRLIISILMEEILKTSQSDKSKPCNLEFLKPVFDGIDVALSQNIKFLSTQSSIPTEQIVKIQELRSMIEGFKTQKG